MNQSVDPLWLKSDVKPDKEMMKFLAGQDVVLDRELIKYDIQASVAHVNGLRRIKILSSDECEQITRCLMELEGEITRGEYELAEPYEDSHSAIEAYLVEHLGNVGKKVHAGRSRNDQVLVASRLYMKERLNDLAVVCLQVAEAALACASKYQMLPMPGYTHLQRAVPSSVGLWMAAFAESFADNAQYTSSVHRQIDQCPLGTAAGYGVNLPLDREGVSAELGFASIQINPMYAQNSRGKFELLAMQALGQATLDVRRLSWDLSLFCCEEFGFVHLPESLCTGSSIMPNKSNPDLVELLRALHSDVVGAQLELDSVLSLPSGYHRDLQSTKSSFIRPWDRAISGLKLVVKLITALDFDQSRMLRAISAPMLTTDYAIEAVKNSGESFRDAYRDQNNPGAIDDLGSKILASLENRVSLGANGNLNLNKISNKIQTVKLSLVKKQKKNPK